MDRLLCVLRVVAALSAALAVGGSNSTAVPLLVNSIHRLTLSSEEIYTFSVSVDASTSNYSAFVFQVHAEGHNLTLRNTSSDCVVERECATNGPHVGLVQLLPNAPLTATFSLTYSCQGQYGLHCTTSQQVLIGVMGIRQYEPIPGGCTLTSALEIEAGFLMTKKNRSSSIIFEDSSIGFYPRYTGQPSCSDEEKFITRLEYKVYQKCLTYPLDDTNKTFDILEHMMTAQGVLDSVPGYPVKKMSYNEAKKVLYETQNKRGIIFNVVATDTKTGLKSAYIPTISYSCDKDTLDCDTVPGTTWAVCILVGSIGLYLCILGHRFFHVEVVVLTLLINTYTMYMLLYSVTDWQGTDLLVSVVGCAVALTLLFFVLWFFTNWYFLFLLIFGVAMGYIITTTILYTPLGTFSVVKVSYVYTLILFSGGLIFMIPLLLFSSVLNIVVTAVIGSYAFMFSMSLFFGAALDDVVLRVVHNAGIRGLLAYNGYCAMARTDILLWSGWLLLCLLSILVQSIIELCRRRLHKKKQAQMSSYVFSTNYEPPVRTKYKAFPSSSLYARLKKKLALRRARNTMQFQTDGQGSGDRRRLVSPNSMTPNNYMSTASY